MNGTIEKAVEALETLPEDVQVPLVAHIVEQAEKYRLLKIAIDEGMADIEAGRVSEWDPDAFLKRAKARQDAAKS